MDHQTRLSAALNRLAAGTSVLRTRAYDSARAERNGDAREEHLEGVILHLESAVNELWSAIDTRPALRKAV